MIPFLVSYTLVTSNAYEVDVVLGQSEISVDVPQGNHFPVNTRVEWKSNLSMSPQTARNLFLQLGDVITRYEELWGPIPYDRAQDRKVDAPNVIRLWEDRVRDQDAPGEPEPPPLSA